MTTHAIPRAFFWRRLHSLMGIWLTIFLIEHLLLNSQTALFIGDDGRSFIHGVNAIKNFPYLPAIEIIFLGIPILIHMIWGIKYARSAKFNSFGYDGKSPYLPEYPRNKLYTWQRITSWILVFGIIAHVIHMRFIEQPASAQKGTQKYYMVKVNLDNGLYTLGERLGFQLYDQHLIQIEKEKAQSFTEKDRSGKDSLNGFFYSLAELFKRPEKSNKNLDPKVQNLVLNQKKMQEKQWIEALEKRPLSAGQAIAVTKDFGTAELLMLRETFKMPIMLVLYTVFVLAACYHGFNGIWTFLIKWGIALTPKIQSIMIKISVVIMVVIGSLGLSSIWLTYWINLGS